MDAQTNAILRSDNLLPGQRIDAHGNTHVHWRGVWILAAPMIANNATQMILNLTDTWFIGRISTEALAAVGSVQWLTFVAIMLFGGVGLAVQTVVAQAFGARRYRRASQATWIGLWATLGTIPIFVAIGLIGPWVLAPFRLEPSIELQATQFWQPRVCGGFLAVALWAVLGFFNGIGKPRIALWGSVLDVVANVALCPLFIFYWNFGVAGAAWATNTAMTLSVLVALIIFLAPIFHRSFSSRRTWRLRVPLLINQWKLGFPMGLMIAADMVGISLFQLMQVRVGTVEGAVTQVVVMLTSIAYMPAVGIALAGTTLVGQSIGAGDRDWAYRVGNAIVILATGYMACIGLLLGLTGPWLLPLFVNSQDPQAAQVIALGVSVIWIGGAYQFFDGLNIASGCCLRGAGDTTIPAILVIMLSWFVFVPIAHMATFTHDNGWFDVLPQFGFGAIGGWWALLIYIVLLGLALLWRWRARAWQKITI
ncbi:MAG TPA: MATE family efflux transporter [Steroidobacteraceae bacterium]|nr:MATE family efflux transporter [Steroidobacteraceae bacterium]